MRRNFDKLIIEAAPALPDSGPSRRVARALLHERMRGHQRQRQVRQRWGLSLAAGLAFGMMFLGQVGPLGSDGFDYTVHLANVDGAGQRLLVDSPMAGPTGSFEAGTSLEFIDSFRQGLAAGEELPKRLFGWQIEGKTLWTMEYWLEVAGDIETHTGPARNLIGYKPEISPAHLEFVAGGAIDDFLALVHGGRIPANHFDHIQSNGLVFNVSSWTQSVPGFGQVTYYSGHPVEQPTPSVLSTK